MVIVSIPVRITQEYASETTLFLSSYLKILLKILGYNDFFDGAEKVLVASCLAVPKVYHIVLTANVKYLMGEAHVKISKVVHPIFKYSVSDRVYWAFRKFSKNILILAFQNGTRAVQRHRICVRLKGMWSGGSL